MTSLYINGEWVDGEGPTFRSYSPIDDSSLWEKNEASNEQVDEAFLSAVNAQPEWAALELNERIHIIEQFAELLRKNSEALANVIALETGKPKWEAETEVGAMANKVKISISAQDKRAGSSHSGNLSLEHHPHGVVAVFGPYNFPGHLPNGHIVPALLAGNSILFKPSEFTPLVAEITVQLWHEAGLPPGVLNLVQGARRVGEAICKQNINALLFTGSSQTGRLIHQQFGGRPEVLLALEMGGNNPLIVDSLVSASNEDNTLQQQLDAMTLIILRSAFLSAGQRCTCARRLIIVEDRYTEKLIETITNTIDKLIVGQDTEEAEAFMGAIIHQPAVKALLKSQEQLFELGGKVLREMKPLSDESYYLSPGLIDMSEVTSPPDEECFGPLLQLFRVPDLDTAISLANNTRYGLAAGLISDNTKSQTTFRQNIRAGVIAINQPTAGASSELPFGGVGASGNHRPSALYAADYCAWPQSAMLGTTISAQGETLNTQNSIRGIRS